MYFDIQERTGWDSKERGFYEQTMTKVIGIKRNYYFNQKPNAVKLLRKMIQGDCMLRAYYTSQYI